LASGKLHRIELNKKVLIREGSVLLVSQLIFVGFLFHGELVGLHGLIMVLVYLLYLGLLYGITQKTKTADPGFEISWKPRKRSPLGSLLMLDMTTLLMHNKKMTAGRAWLLMGISTVIMSFGTWLLVYGTDLFGEITHIPLIFVAVVLSAAATSVPDTVISIKDARKGNYDDAVSNALGSNIFDIAFALGFPILMYNLIYREPMELDPELLVFTKEVWVFLLLATFIAVLTMLIGRRFGKWHAFIMLGIYLMFLFFVGTHVGEGIEGIGSPIGEFLKNVADWIGTLFSQQ
jgi:cation:H+ antiporter